MASSEAFKHCTLVPISNLNEDSAWNVASAPDGSSWKTSSFFLDSSGRSSVHLPLQLKCPSRAFLERLVQSKAFDSYNVIGAGQKLASDVTDDAGEQQVEANSALGAKFCIEAKVTLTFGTGEALSASVEDVILSSVLIRGDSVVLDACVMVRVSRADGERFSVGPTSRVKTNLELSGVLVQELESPNDRSLSSIGLDSRSLGSAFPASRAMRIQHTRLAPVALLVVISHAMSVSVHCLQGPALGQTFVSVTVRHSNTHSEPVTVSRIAIHPGHSMERLTAPSHSHSAQAATVTDMSKAVQWMYAPKCDPLLPVVLRPYEAISTILAVHATDDRRSRSFSSPLSITAVVGDASEGADIADSADDASKASKLSALAPKLLSVVAAAEVTFATYRAPVEPSDAFRVDMRIVGVDPKESGLSNLPSPVSPVAVRVGSLFGVRLEISNLSSDTRDVLVLVDGTAPASIADGPRSSLVVAESAESAVVSEKDGSTFCVRGLAVNHDHGDLASDPAPSGDRESAGRSDDDLHFIDSAVHVGEVKGGSSGTATLRLVPLRAGTLPIPKLQLLDRRRGKRYDAPHNLSVVVGTG